MGESPNLFFYFEGNLSISSKGSVKVNDDIFNIDAPPSRNIYSQLRHLKPPGHLSCRFVKFVNFFVNFFIKELINHVPNSRLKPCFQHALLKRRPSAVNSKLEGYPTGNEYRFLIGI